MPVDRTESGVIVGVEPNLVYRRVMVNVPSIEQLTENQRVCLRMVLTRHSSKEIAIELGISESAVNKRLERAVQQLGASSRFAAARKLAAAEGERAERHGAYAATSRRRQAHPPHQTASASCSAF